MEPPNFKFEVEVPKVLGGTLIWKGTHKFSQKRRCSAMQRRTFRNAYTQLPPRSRKNTRRRNAGRRSLHKKKSRHR